MQDPVFSEAVPMMLWSGRLRVYLANGTADIRNSIDTLAILMAELSGQAPLYGPCLVSAAGSGTRQNPLLGPKRILSMAQTMGAISVPVATDPRRCTVRRHA